MTFNIADFKANINRLGINTTSKFAVNITPPIALQTADSGLLETTIPGEPARATITASQTTQDLRMLCDSANIPGKQLQTIEYKPQGFGAISKMPTGMTMDPLNLTFFLDSRHRVQRFFQLWMQEIINTGSSSAGEQASYRNRTSYEMNYKSKYTTTVILQYFSDDNPNESISYYFHDAYPVQIGSVQLAWEQNDQIGKLPVEFTYKSYDVFRDQLDYPVADTRGPNLFQTISALGSIAGVINNIDRPTSIQDAINQFTRLDNLARNLDRIF